MSKLFLVLLGLFCVLSPAQALPQDLIVIVIDDMDWQTYDDVNVSLPTLDKIRKQGTFYRGVYSHSRCAPSLASLITGLIPPVHGRLGNAQPGHVLDPQLSLVHTLKVQGYATFVTGKWWNGPVEPYGFDAGFDTDQPWIELVRATQDPVLSWLSSVPDCDPLCLVWAPKLPHEPHDAPAEFDAGIATALPAPPYLEAGQSLSQYRFKQRKYLAAAQWFDKGLLDLGKRLKQLGRTDARVLVVVDNGYRIGAPGKGTWFDAGLRCPAILVGPDQVAGAESNRLLTIEDVSRWAFLGEALPVRECLVTRDYTGEATGDLSADLMFTAVISPPYKLVRIEQDIRELDNDRLKIRSILAAFPERDAGDLELYDLSLDPFELNDVAAANPALVQQLLGKIK